MFELLLRKLVILSLLPYGKKLVIASSPLYSSIAIAFGKRDPLLIVFCDLFKTANDRRG